MRRRVLRQIALQALYQIDVGKTDAASALEHVFSEVGPTAPGDREYVRRLVEGTVEARSNADRLLSEHVDGWRLERIAKVDLNILRLALYELAHEPDVDVGTIVNEAVELAKHYSTEDSGRFVNGVLSKILPYARPQA